MSEIEPIAALLRGKTDAFIHRGQAKPSTETCPTCGVPLSKRAWAEDYRPKQGDIQMGIQAYCSNRQCADFLKEFSNRMLK